LEASGPCDMVRGSIPAMPRRCNHFAQRKTHFAARPPSAVVAGSQQIQRAGRSPTSMSAFSCRLTFGRCFATTIACPLTVARVAARGVGYAHAHWQIPLHLRTTPLPHRQRATRHAGTQRRRKPHSAGCCCAGAQLAFSIARYRVQLRVLRSRNHSSISWQTNSQQAPRQPRT